MVEDNTNINDNQIARIKVIGVGGGGNNTVHSMITEGIQGVDFIVANTDDQVLKTSIAKKKLNLGKTARGLGSGANPEIGHKSALESEDEIRGMLKGADMVIIAAGMGGGTGTGASPVIGKIAKELGALTIGIVTTPFMFEGRKRVENAKQGVIALGKNVDSIIIVSNDKLLKQFGDISLKDSFMYADKVLKQTVRTITDLIAVPALINLDFADVSTVMKGKGHALIGIGRATGKDRAMKAASHAISSPILSRSILGAKDAIINISGGDITLQEANMAVETIQQAAGNDINIIFGVSIIERLKDEIQISVIATGLEKSKQLDEIEIKKDISKALSKVSVAFEDDHTRELLIKDPLPENEKMNIKDEVIIRKSNPFSKFENDDDDDDLPLFLKR